MVERRALVLSAGITREQDDATASLRHLIVSGGARVERPDANADPALVLVNGITQQLPSGDTLWSAGPAPASIGFVVGNSSSPTADDVAIRNRLASTLGHTVTYIDDSASSTDLTTYDLAVISVSVNAGSTGWALNQAVPTLIHDGDMLGDARVAYNYSYNYGEYTTGIIQGSHWINDGVAADGAQVTLYNSNIDHGGTLGWPGSVVSIVSDGTSGNPNNDLSRNMVFEAGATLISGTAAERIGWFAAADFSDFAATGLALWDRTVGWLLYEDAA